MKQDTLLRLIEARATKRPVALVTDLGTGQQSLVFETIVQGDFGLSDDALRTVRDRLAQDRSGPVALGDDIEGFVAVFAPPPRLLLVGAVHIAQALVPMAAQAGFDAVVIDPRRGFASEARFPGLTVVPEWPDDALKAIGLDHRCALVTLTHDPKLDDPALAEALNAPVFFIGALGSRKTHAARLERLTAMGLADTQLARIHGPVGLPIGADSPGEIAVSILAQVVAHRRGKAPESNA